MYIAVRKNIIPYFSVIVTTYNRAHLLHRSFDSLLKQVELDWECIIVDDGSTDETFNICRKYLDADPRFKYIFHSNRGQALSKNAGILASSGIYATFLDSDDEYRNDHLDIRHKVLNQNPQVELLHGGVKINGNKYVPDMNDTSKLIHLSDCIIGGTFVIRKEKAIELGGFKALPYGDDTEFYERAVKKGLVIAKIAYSSYIYNRNSPDSICNNIKKSK
ncbi:MAG: glycosyl transferase [Ignavibacteriae bacterium HGW-Ignavibacteriae-1]|jgi:glycosyltransferase involved in cell wall biosynthesis|nr:MAG: glycosyl transferase [Ignavibacteriae bacterium HGW-Ignavibacteriae-1]